jgi:exodeoxyribonuclease VII small subunit
MNNKKKISLEEILQSSDPSSLVNNIEFEEGIKLLDGLCGQIESGELPLAAAVNYYEIGSLLIAALKRELTEAEEKIKVFQPNLVT